MSDIIRAREKIGQIARELKERGQSDLAVRLQGVLELMRRRPAARRMAVRSESVTPEIRRKVLYFARNTNMHSAEIAVALNLNPGRVSEILQGDK